MRTKSTNMQESVGTDAVVGLRQKSIGALLMEHNALVILVILCIISTIISP